MPKISNPIFDVNDLLTRVDNDRDLMREILLIFKEEFPRHRESLRAAVHSSDAAKVAAEAHSLKGMLANMAAVPASTAAARLENLGRAGDVLHFAEAHAAFEEISEELLVQLEVCMAEVCP